MKRFDDGGLSGIVRTDKNGDRRELNLNIVQAPQPGDTDSVDTNGHVCSCITSVFSFAAGKNDGSRFIG